MLKKLLKKDEGFTLIEIVLVLAIAGLILVIVFLAVNGAQRARRDTQRKSDASRAFALAGQLASNLGGTLPTVAQLNAAFTSPVQYDPDGTAYTVSATAAPALHVIGYTAGAFCPGVAGATARNYAVYGHQETATALPFCVDDH